MASCPVQNRGSAMSTYVGTSSPTLCSRVVLRCCQALVSAWPRSLVLLHLPLWGSRWLLRLKGNTAFGSVVPSFHPSPPSNRCGFPRQNTMRQAPPLSIASACDFRDLFWSWWNFAAVALWGFHVAEGQLKLSGSWNLSWWFQHCTVKRKDPEMGSSRGKKTRRMMTVPHSTLFSKIHNWIPSIRYPPYLALSVQDLGQCVRVDDSGRLLDCRWLQPLRPMPSAPNFLHDDSLHHPVNSQVIVTRRWHMVFKCTDVCVWEVWRHFQLLISRQTFSWFSNVFDWIGPAIWGRNVIRVGTSQARAGWLCLWPCLWHWAWLTSIINP